MAAGAMGYGFSLYQKMKNRSNVTHLNIRSWTLSFLVDDPAKVECLRVVSELISNLLGLQLLSKA